MNIPEKFYKVDAKPIIARTVGELKRILEELPEDLRIESGLDNSIQLLVYNHGEHDMHLSIEGAISEFIDEEEE